jgi:hypothetical protein
MLAMTAPRTRRWIGFFLVLFVLSLSAILVNFVYNLSIQLKPEQLAEAQRRWQENAPAYYDLLVRTESGPDESQSYHVQVRSGRVVMIVQDDELVYLEASLGGIAGSGVLALSVVEPRQYGVAALFAEIEAALHDGNSDGRRDYLKADFDPKDGHPYHYIHRVRGTKQRVEWFVKLTRVESK